MIEIPLTSDPEQNFTITLNGTNYGIRVILNSRTGLWTINFSIDEVPLVNGVGLVGGVDILSQYNLDISNVFMVNLASPNQDPSKDSLGTNARLFMLTDEEVAGG